jgi:hypothetical protein
MFELVEIPFLTSGYSGGVRLTRKNILLRRRGTCPNPLSTHPTCSVLGLNPDVRGVKRLNHVRHGQSVLLVMCNIS